MNKTKNIIKLLGWCWVSFSILLAGVVILVLFFMWYPDFIAWYSIKIAGIKRSFIFEVIPLCVLIGGLSVTIMFLLTAVFYVQKQEIEEVKDE